MSRAVRALLIVLSLILGLTSAFAVEVRTQGPVVVMVDRSPSGFVYTINSTVPPKGLLLTLSLMRSEGGEAPSEAILLVHETAPLATVNNVRGIMTKAGFSEPRVFYFGEEKEWMAEITFSKSIPYSAGGVPPAKTKGRE